MKRPVEGLSKRGLPKSRTYRLLSRLLETEPDEWIPAPDLAKIGGLQLNARLWELRHRLKFDIENKIESIGGEKRSWYRLRRGMSDSLFGNIAPDRSYWE
ncbi:MAG TPA: hypothetical protein VHR84_16465 [Terriglobales bacterium]|jgi:hypothetical protein|nr:hypothetical protein [Terriglobales bacterium]